MLLDEGVVLVDRLVVLCKPAGLLGIHDGRFERALHYVGEIEAERLRSVNEIEPERQVGRRLSC